MVESLSDFNIFLKRTIFERMNFCEESHIVADELHKRNEDYPDLKEMLLKNGVHHEDIIIAIDAHDFSKTLDSPLDFITFDKKFCRGLLKSNLSFNKVKCLNDYDFLT